MKPPASPRRRKPGSLHCQDTAPVLLKTCSAGGGGNCSWVSAGVMVALGTWQSLMFFQGCPGAQQSRGQCSWPCWGQPGAWWHHAHTVPSCTTAAVGVVPCGPGEIAHQGLKGLLSPREEDRGSLLSFLARRGDRHGEQSPGEVRLLSAPWPQWPPLDSHLMDNREPTRGAELP